MSTCKYCGASIVWVKEGRRNIAIDQDGLKHVCEEFKKARQVKKISKVDIDPELLKQYEQGINSKK